MPPHISPSAQLAARRHSSSTYSYNKHYVPYLSHTHTNIPPPFHSSHSHSQPPAPSSSSSCVPHPHRHVAPHHHHTSSRRLSSHYHNFQHQHPHQSKRPTLEFQMDPQATLPVIVARPPPSPPPRAPAPLRTPAPGMQQGNESWKTGTSTSTSTATAPFVDVDDDYAGHDGSNRSMGMLRRKNRGKEWEWNWRKLRINRVPKDKEKSPDQRHSNATPLHDTPFQHPDRTEDAAGKGTRRLANRKLSRNNLVDRNDPKLNDAVAALSGSIPAYVLQGDAEFKPSIWNDYRQRMDRLAHDDEFIDYLTAPLSPESSDNQHKKIDVRDSCAPLRRSGGFLRSASSSANFRGSSAGTGTGAATGIYANKVGSKSWKGSSSAAPSSFNSIPKASVGVNVNANASNPAKACPNWSSSTASSSTACVSLFGSGSSNDTKLMASSARREAGRAGDVPPQEQKREEEDDDEIVGDEVVEEVSVPIATPVEQEEGAQEEMSDNGGRRGKKKQKQKQKPRWSVRNIHAPQLAVNKLYPLAFIRLLEAHARNAAENDAIDKESEQFHFTQQRQVDEEERAHMNMNMNMNGPATQGHQGILEMDDCVDIVFEAPDDDEEDDDDEDVVQESVNEHRKSGQAYSNRHVSMSKERMNRAPSWGVGLGRFNRLSSTAGMGRVAKESDNDGEYDVDFTTAADQEQEQRKCDMRRRSYGFGGWRNGPATQRTRGLGGRTGLRASADLSHMLRDTFTHNSNSGMFAQGQGQGQGRQSKTRPVAKQWQRSRQGQRVFMEEEERRHRQSKQRLRSGGKSHGHSNFVPVC